MAKSQTTPEDGSQWIKRDRSEGDASRPGYPKAPKGIEIRGGKVFGAGLVKDPGTGKLVVPERHRSS